MVIATCRRWLCWFHLCGFVLMAFPKILFLAAFLLLLSFWVDLCHQANDEEDYDEENSSQQALLESPKSKAGLSNMDTSWKCCSFQGIRVGSRQKIVIVVVLLNLVIMISFAAIIWIGAGKNPSDSLDIARVYIDYFAISVLIIGGAFGFYGENRLLLLLLVDAMQVVGLSVVSVSCFTSSSLIALLTDIPLFRHWDLKSINGVKALILLILHYVLGSSVPFAFVLWVIREMPSPPTINRQVQRRAITFISSEAAGVHHPQYWTTATSSKNQGERIRELMEFGDAASAIGRMSWTDPMASTSGTKRPPRPPPPPPFARLSWPREQRNQDFNILPFDESPIMKLPEIKVAVELVSRMENLPSIDGFVERDIFDWLSAVFGFQKGNTANQREHLILLLSNIYTRKKNLGGYNDQVDTITRTIKQLKDGFFSNYELWCKYMHLSSCVRNHERYTEQQPQLHLIYIALYLLIWGEASNIRFMPECICYIFHKMANDVHQVLSSMETNRRSADNFLSTVISPIYQILSEEAEKGKQGRASHSLWSNYDDLNECFWSNKCSSELHKHKEGIPLPPADTILKQFIVGNRCSIGRRKPKTNFVEVRTFLQLYRSFDRMWIFFIMALQAMIIVAWVHRGSTSVNNEEVIRRVLSIFITYAILSFLRAILDIILSIRAWRITEFSQILHFLLKLVVASIWVVVLLVGYSTSMKSPTGLKFLDHLTGDAYNQSLYNYLVVLYLIPDVLSIILFLLPPLREKLELSNWTIINIVMWWSQPKAYVGRGMHVGIFSLLKYAIFWILVLSVKLAFSYFVEILPLVRPTKAIIKIDIEDYQLHKLVPNAKYNMGVIIAIWAPIVLVYFMDVQIWYTIFSTILGGVLGAFRHLGEIRTIGMLQSRFESMPSAFDRCFVSSSGHSSKIKIWRNSKEPKNMAKFSWMWNEFIQSMRMEDLISNRDRDLLLLPVPLSDESMVQWPLFLLASKIPEALNTAKEYKGKDDAELKRMIGSDKYVHSAILDCYYTLGNLIYCLLEDEDDKKIVEEIYDAVDESLKDRTFLQNFSMRGMPSLVVKLEKLLNILMEDDEDDKVFKTRITIALQDIMETIMLDVMINDKSTVGVDQNRNQVYQKYNRRQRFTKINITDIKDKFWSEKVHRLRLLFTVKESGTNVPMNSEARRRLTFFANSLFMNMRSAPKVTNMRSFSVLTPHYKEDVIYSEQELNKENEDGVSILFYLKTIYPDEWTNFLERMNFKPNGEDIRKWVSYRGQTLSRSGVVGDVRGMMYYKKALELQCSLEFTDAISSEDDVIRKQFLPDLKFTYVVSCQIYGALKSSNDPRQKDILNLMLMYPSLRIAYIDEVDEPVKGNAEGKTHKVHYSVLLKGDTFNGREREIYRIKLPGPPTKIGEGKPENQNHAIIFTRGEALQTIDMNQDNYFEEAYKMRNVLEEFPHSHGAQKPTILGLREHVFTGSVSSLAWFMSNQETSFVTIGQRFLASPLRVRFHYGHPDIFDRIFHITRGGISKASKTINLSEDIFAGFNSTLRGGYVTHHDYIQVGKGRDVGMNQISLFEAKVANGNGEQTLSRDVHRLGCRFDFFRMLSFYCTTVGFYFNSLVTVLIVYLFLYGRLYMVISGLEREILENPIIKQDKTLEAALVTQSFIQMGMLMVLPMLMEIGLEKGFLTALGDFIMMQLQLASLFFTFQLGTKAHYFGRTILHGGSKYRATGRGFVVVHAKFADNYRLYSRSHFVKALELALLLVIYEAYGKSYRSSSLYLFITFSMWFLVGSWLFAPFIFNPSGFEWQKTVDDWTDWKRWMGIHGGVGIQPEKSWESWWDEEQEHLRYTSLRGRVLEIVLALRFFFYQYGIVYHLDIAHHRRSFLVYGLSWCVVLVLLIVPKMVSVRRANMFHMDLQLVLRMLKGLVFLFFLAIIIILFKFSGLSVSDLFASILAFMPTGWAFILIGQACRPLLQNLIWGPIKELARAYDYIMGLLIFTPIAILSWLPSVSEFQTRLLFNQAFSRGLHISMILAGKKDRNPAN
ncbi:Glycosyl transferase, family 48 [Corchorus olitorius]|uniref:1,3-beta-glucan synthase n=1 Tax=Corchorus olitorius TaxID=93759 RepID=A0A1R3KKP2_9ROSI|nr:Glycosyl transferase, family 48 [Corchorus olitorius]